MKPNRRPHATIGPLITLSLRSLVRRPLQSALVLFALVGSLTSTVTLMAVLAGVDQQIRSDLAGIGVDLVNVHVSPTFQNLLSSPLTAKDCDWMERESLGTVAPFLANFGVAQREEKIEQALILSVTPAWGEIAAGEWLEGRFFVEGETKCCVLDEWVKHRLFSDEKAVGKTIRLGSGEEVEVIGVLKDPFQIRSRFEELDFLGSARSRMLGMMEFKSVFVPETFSDPNSRIHGAVIQVPPGYDPEALVPELIDALGPERKESVWIWARLGWMNDALSATDIATTIASVIWIIVLLVTGVMIATVSLVAIRERYREIAIRRTEGGRRPQIAGQLLLENVMLSTVAGLLAIALSRLAAEPLQERYLSWRLYYRTEDVVLVLGLGVVLGAMATVVPALRAASLDPVEVLRRG